MPISALSLAILFKAPQLIKGVAGMLGLIATVDDKLDTLLRTDFNAGIRHLNELLVAEKEHDFLLKEAWRRFETAILHEAGDRKALAYLGLAYCQYQLEERYCAKITLEEFVKYRYTSAADIGGVVSSIMDVGLFILSPLSFIAISAITAAYNYNLTKNAKLQTNSVGGVDHGTTSNDDLVLELLKATMAVPSSARIAFLQEKAKKFLEDEYI